MTVWFAELKRRENLDEIVCETLAQGWSAQHGTPFRVTCGASAGERWVAQHLLGFYHPTDPSSRVRRFMADAFRYSRRPIRVVPQWVMGTFAASPIGLRLLATPAFTVTPALPGSRDVAIWPGNQRVRVFDFGRGTCRVMLKRGFAVRSMTTEITVRGNEASGPFPPIFRFDEAHDWFEEPIVAGQNLARLPAWVPSAAYEAELFRRLGTWLERTARGMPAGEYVEGVRAEIVALAEAVESRFGGRWRSRADGIGRRLFATASGLGDIPIAEGHGDLQRGNVLVTDKGEVLLVDWEHAGLRFRYYDHLVFGLSGRSPVGLGERLVRFQRSGAIGLPGWALPEKGSALWRRAASALYVLEETRWYLAENLTGVYRRPSRSVRQFFDEVDPVASDL